MRRRTPRVVVPVPVPAFELWVGMAWWTVGATAFDAGTGTAVLAAGLVAMGWLVLTVRRAHGTGAPLPRGGRGELLRRGGVALGLIVALSMGLPVLDRGELVVPLACVLVGFALLRLPGLLVAGSFAVVGTGLVALGVGGVLLARNTPDQVYGQGLVGLGAGVLLWLAGAYRTRALAARYRRR